VFYHVCTEMSMDLILYPKTIAPLSGLKTVTTRCAEGAEGELNSNVVINCLPNGVWASIQVGTGCRCKPGYFKSSGLEECIGEVDYYFYYSFSYCTF